MKQRSLRAALAVGIAGLVVLVPGALIAGCLLVAPASAATTRTVCASGCDFTTISAAVAAAVAGDTIEVRGGTYAESVAVTKSLTIKATIPGTTVIPGPTFGDAGFRLQADGVRIEGFTIGNRNAITATVGIDVANRSGAVLGDDLIVNNERGVSLNGASNVTVSNSRFSDNNGNGPNNNAALWGDNVTGITIDGSTFTGHTNTAINLAGSSQITISKSRFEDNANFAVIWQDSNVTISGNTGTLMRAAGIFVNQSSNVTISGNDLAARAADTAGVSVSAITGPSSALKVSGNVLRGFARGLNVGNGGVSDSLVASGNQFLTTAIGVRNQGTVLVDARGNWWAAPSGPADPVAGDGSVPATNAGSGVSAVGAVDYRNWCTTATCTSPPPVARVPAKLKTKVVTRSNGARVLKIKAVAKGASVNGGKIVVRKNDQDIDKRKACDGCWRQVNLGKLHPGTHTYTVVFKKTDTVDRADKKVKIRVH